MTSMGRNVAFDCADPYPLAGFWAAVTGHPIGQWDKPGDPEVSIETPGGTG